MNSIPIQTLTDRLDAALPQTQCTRCGFPDCRAYAAAIASGHADINQCPPGGAAGIHKLAAITGLTASPLSPTNGSEGPRSLAVINEDWCIGCTLCLEACPTDAIMGSNKVMHTVIEPYCTGCELCIPVCPVDCISLENSSGMLSGWQAWSQAQADLALQRYKVHSKRYMEGLHSKPISHKKPEQMAVQPETAADKKRAVIDAALARARASRKQPPTD